MIKKWSWCERYSLNHPKLDAQHQEFFELANSLEMLEKNILAKENLSKLLQQFFSYMREHFEDEESYMLSIDYPLREKHIQQHQYYIECITNLLKETKGMQTLHQKLKDFAFNMIQNHILNDDLHIEKWKKDYYVNIEALELLKEIDN